MSFQNNNRAHGWTAVVLTLAFVVMLSPVAGSASFAGSAAAAPGDVTYRVNGGGADVAAVDGGPDWGTPGSTSGVTVSGGQTYSTGDGITLDSSVPSGTPGAVFQSELYGDTQWEFDVTSGTTYEVRLYFAEIFQTSDGAREFDASVEGQQVLDSYDIHAEVGHDVGVMKSYEVTPSDGTIDVDFTTVTDNAKVSAIEIVEASPEPGVLDGPSGVDFGQVLDGNSETETVTLTNAGETGDTDITVSDVSVTGADATDFSTDFSGSATLGPGESLDVQVTFTPSSVDPKSATLEVSHDAPNTTAPLTVDLTGEGASAVDPNFGKSTLQGFSAGNPTALEWGPDDRLYVSTQGGTVYALDVERTGENSYQVVNEVQIDAIKDIPNHDDFGNLDSGNNRQITGLTVGGTASQPVVYVGSSDPEIDVGTDDDDTDTNSGAISRLTIDPGSDGTLQASEVTHEVMVFGLPRSEENHATNGLDLSPDGTTMYVAQGGHTNKGAPGDNFGHTPEYALSAAVLEIDLAQIESNYQAKSLNNYNSSYPNLDFYYAIPTIQNDDATDGDDLPFGGNDGINQAKLIEGGPVQIYSPGYRNPYDLVLAESGQLYVSDHGPNGGWGGQPADASGNTVSDASSVTNHPNEDGSFSTNDQLIAADEGEYGGHAAPIRANPTQADIYDSNGNVKFDITSSNSPVPSSMVNPVEADYIPPTSGSPDPGAPAGSANTMETTGGQKVLFGPTGGTEEYTASNFGGAMQGDILQVELGGDIERVELSADGQTATNVETIFNTGGPLGIAAQDDDEVFPGTVWTANHGGNDITVFEPVDYNGTVVDDCTGADDASLDEDGDGYDNADEIDVGTDPCSASSTPADFDDDGESNLNDPDDDNDGAVDSVDPFAVDADNGTTTTLPVEHDLSELSLLGENGQGWTGLMTNGQDDYQDLYDPTSMTVGGAAEVLTVEQVPPGDAYSSNNDQQYAFQFGVNPPDEPFVVETTVASFPENPENFQSAGIQIGPGDQSNYAKLVVAADGGNGGVEFAQEEGDSFTHQTSPSVVSDSAVTGNDTTLYLTVDPTTDPMPNNGEDEVAVTAEYEVNGQNSTVGTAAVPASWLDTSDGSGLAVGVISTSNGASSTFSATWTDISVNYVNPPANQPPTADAGADQTVDEGTEVTLDASGSGDPDGDQIGYTWTQTAGPDVSLSVNDGETTTFTAPDVDGDQTLTFEVAVSDGQASDTDTVNVTVQDTDTATGEVVYRVNAGGQEVAASDGGPAWSADTDGSPSQYVNADGDNGLNTYSTGDTITLDSSASGTPTSLFQTERYDVNTSGSTADDTEMQYSFPVQSGQTYEVRLYFAEIFLESTSDNQYPREFAVTAEGDTKLNNYNIFDQYGHDVGAMESFQVTPSDGTIDMEFLHQQENPKISAIEIVAVGDTGSLTVAEAVAAHDDGDDTINLQEIQTAINWWATGSEVPDTGGETISLTQMQQLINTWATGATVGDGGGGSDTTGSALVEVTPDTALETSTYGSGSYQVTNTGEKNISSVSFDLSSASYPDMVFDPAGTAGDPTGEGLNIASDGGTDITTQAGTGEAFSQPHNGVDDSDGYDVMTVEFGDFNPGETATFWADNDPTSIKGATVGSQEAGPVSGLELARSTVTVTYEDGTTQTTQLMGDGSAGGSTAVLDGNEAPAPTIGADGVSLDGSVLDGYHSAATVSEASQTITVTGQPGETVTLVRVEGELSLSNVPDADNDGEPGYDLEAYEANDAQNVEYYTVTLDSNGEATVPVTLTNTVNDEDGSSDDDAGYNYFVAAEGQASGDMGLASNVVVLEYEPDAGSTTSADVTVNAGSSSIDASTFNGGSFEITNTGDEQLSSLEIDLSESAIPDAVFDPQGTAGDSGAKGLVIDSESGDGVGVVSTADGDVFSQPHNGVDGDDGYDAMTVEFGDFDPGETMTFSVDIDPTTIKDASTTGGEGSVSGLELSGSAVTVSSSSATVSNDLFTDGSQAGSQSSVSSDASAAPTLGVDGVTLQSTDFPSHQAATVSSASQTLTLSGPAGATVELLTVEASAPPSDGYDVDAYEADNAEAVSTQTVTLDSNGQATVPVSLSESNLNYFQAAVQDGSSTGQVSQTVVLDYDSGSSTAQVLYRVNAGGPALSAADSGPDWEAGDGTYVVAGGGSTDSWAPATIDSSVPQSTPPELFETERWDGESSPEMQYELDVPDGTDVEVRLYFRSGWDGADQPGERVFNVTIEDQTVLGDYDIVADVGHDTGVMKSFTVTSDGTIDIDFTHVTQNPLINGIEIVESGGSN